MVYVPPSLFFITHSEEGRAQLELLGHMHDDAVALNMRAAQRQRVSAEFRLANNRMEVKVEDS